MALAHFPSIATDDLIFYLDAANPKSYTGTGTSWNDIIGTNHGVLVNGPTYNLSNSGYFSFDGTNQEVTTTNWLGSFAYTNNFTMCGWFRTSVASGRKIIGLEYTKTGGSLYAFASVYITTSGKLGATTYSTGYRSMASTPSYNDNTWHNFALTQTLGTSTELFVDGISQCTMPYTTDLSLGMWLRIAGYVGKPSDSTTGGFAGDISALSLYSRTLSTAEIQNNFNALKGRYNV